MKQKFYKLPFDFERFFENKDFEKVSLNDSVLQQISMLITTAYKEYKHDYDFGSEIWETDFDLLSNVNKLKEDIRFSLLEKIKKYETRLNNIRVSVTIGETYVPNVNQTRLKKQMLIQVTGRLKKTNDTFVFNGSYFIAPLSYYDF